MDPDVCGRMITVDQMEQWAAQVAPTARTVRTENARCYALRMSDDLGRAIAANVGCDAVEVKDGGRVLCCRLCHWDPETLPRPCDPARHEAYYARIEAGPPPWR